MQYILRTLICVYSIVCLHQYTRIYTVLYSVYTCHYQDFKAAEEAEALKVEVLLRKDDPGYLSQCTIYVYAIVYDCECITCYLRALP